MLYLWSKGLSLSPTTCTELEIRDVSRKKFVSLLDMSHLPLTFVLFLCSSSEKYLKRIVYCCDLCFLSTRWASVSSFHRKASPKSSMTSNDLQEAKPDYIVLIVLSFSAVLPPPNTWYLTQSSSQGSLPPPLLDPLSKRLLHRGGGPSFSCLLSLDFQWKENHFQELGLLVGAQRKFSPCREEEGVTFWLLLVC